MGPFLRQHGLRVVGLLILLYILFLMPLGDHSFAGHVVRILKTPELQELGEEIVNKVDDVVGGAKRRVQLAFGRYRDD